MPEPIISDSKTTDRMVVLQRVAAVVLLLFVFLLGVKGLGDGFKLLGRDLLDAFFRATDNPFMALMVGILGTTLVQSSSVTTSMIVALVAAPENALPVANAVPMIMGANIGTTVTNTIVSLAHLGRKDEFYRAFSAATCHDFFNYLTVATLLPLELATGYLRRAATWLTEVLLAGGGPGGVTFESPLKVLLKLAFTPVIKFAELVSDLQQVQGVVQIVISGALIFGALFMLVRVMRSALQTRVEGAITKVLGRMGMVAIFVGIAVTFMVQSSSITTSLLIPLAGAGLITLEQVFPITIGANIGTTITALLASMAGSGVNAGAGLTIALVHLLFNLTGTVLIYPFPVTRRIPLVAARKLAEVATRSRRWALIYVAGLFYGIPALFAYLDHLF